MPMQTPLLAAESIENSPETSPMFAIRASLTGIAFFSVVRRPEFSNSLRWEVAIERGSSDFELPDDVIDEGIVLPVWEAQQSVGQLNFGFHGGRGLR